MWQLYISRTLQYPYTTAGFTELISWLTNISWLPYIVLCDGVAGWDHSDIKQGGERNGED